MRILPPVTWFGGKSKLAGRIFGRDPDQIVRVVPVGGAAAVLWARPGEQLEVRAHFERALSTYSQVLRDLRRSSRPNLVCTKRRCSWVGFEPAREPVDDLPDSARRFSPDQGPSRGIGRRARRRVGTVRRFLSDGIPGWLSNSKYRYVNRRRIGRVMIESADCPDAFTRCSMPGAPICLGSPCPAHRAIDAYFFLPNL